ncbi:MAG: GspE/PulE family protein [Thermodesulfobacteriota bacterium]
MTKEKKSLGQYLVNLGVITDEQLKKAVQEARQKGERLEQTLMRMSLAKEEVLLQCMANYFNIPYVDLDTYIIDEEVLKLVPEDLARRHTLIPLFKIGNTLTIAVDNPLNIHALDDVKNKTKTEVEIALSTEKKIKKAIELRYGGRGAERESPLEQFSYKGRVDTSEEDIEYRKTYDLQIKDSVIPMEGASVTQMFDLVMVQAIRDKASDIHFEPDEKELRVRFRIDGFLYEILTLPKALHPAITSRIKIMAEMDIAETRLPQDGNFNVRMENRSFEIRVSTFPTIYGENVVLRLLDQTSPLLTLEELGFSDDMLLQYKQILRKSNGMVLVTGPTGSGKTTTLYASLNMINSLDKNIITIEDPVEYRLSLIRQTQVNPRAGITFATGLRSILRQDPDVIMVGEIRDLETSEVAIQAALTGHLVFSTLHTNNAPEAITRLLDIGVEPYLISSSIVGVLAQRLVRRICPQCKVQAPQDQDLLRELGEMVSSLKEPPVFYRGTGCTYCKGSGYRGRIGIFELLVINDRIKRLISEKASVEKIREIARETEGLKSFREDGLLKVLKGITTRDEIDRVAYEYSS